MFPLVRNELEMRPLYGVLHKTDHRFTRQHQFQMAHESGGHAKAGGVQSSKRHTKRMPCTALFRAVACPGVFSAPESITTPTELPLRAGPSKQKANNSFHTGSRPNAWRIRRNNIAWL
jgi:hypothetical protein